MSIDYDKMFPGLYSVETERFINKGWVVNTTYKNDNYKTIIIFKALEDSDYNRALRESKRLLKIRGGILDPYILKSRIDKATQQNNINNSIVSKKRKI